jgi:hypothetical protein
MPLAVLNGALVTHPFTSAARGQVMSNPFHDRDITVPPSVHDPEVSAKLRTLTRVAQRSARRPRHF